MFFACEPDFEPELSRIELDFPRIEPDLKLLVDLRCMFAALDAPGGGRVYPNYKVL